MPALPDRPDDELAAICADRARVLLEKDTPGLVAAANAYATLALFYQQRSGVVNAGIEARLSAVRQATEDVSGRVMIVAHQVEDVKTTIGGVQYAVERLRDSFGHRIFDRVSGWWGRIAEYWTPRPPWVETFESEARKPPQPLPMFMVDKMSGTEFEQHVVQLLGRLGWGEVTHNGGAGDHGVDIVARQDGHVLAVQCKRYAPKTQNGSGEVQKFAGGASRIHNADTLVFITTSRLTAGALVFAEQANIHVVDRNAVEEWQRTGMPPQALIAPGFETEVIRSTGAAVDRTAPPPDKPRQPAWRTMLTPLLLTIAVWVGTANRDVVFHVQDEAIPVRGVVWFAAGIVVFHLVLSWLSFWWRNHWWKRAKELHWPMWTREPDGSWSNLVDDWFQPAPAPDVVLSDSPRGPSAPGTGTAT